MEEMKDNNQEGQLVIIFYCPMQTGSEQISVQVSDNRASNVEDIESSLKVRVVDEKKKLIVSDLNLSNPEDRALSLCLKMVEMRKRREERQNKLIEEIRKSRVLDCTVGQVPRAIARDHFIARHEYLRQTQYRIDRPRIVINRALAGSQLVGGEKQKALKREIEVLEKSKQFTHRYEVRRMIQEILDDAIDYSITMHERKKKFHHKNQSAIVESTLEKQWERRAKGKKGSLSLSRVIDLKMVPSDAESKSQSSSQSDEQNIENSSKKSESNNSNTNSHESQPKEDESGSNSQSNEEKQQQQNQAEQSISSDHA